MLSHAKLKKTEQKYDKNGDLVSTDDDCYNATVIGCFLPNGPIIRDGDKKITGLLAIIALLHHMNFFKHINELLQRYDSEILSTENTQGLEITQPFYDIFFFNSLSDYNLHPAQKEQVYDTVEQMNKNLFEMCKSPVTPTLVNTIIKILRNLLAMAPQDTLIGMENGKAIKSTAALISPQSLLELNKYLVVGQEAQVFSTSQEAEENQKEKLVNRTKFVSLINQYTQTVKMLSLQMLLFDSTVGPQIIKEPVILTAVFGLMSIRARKDKDNAPYSLGRDQDKALNDMRISLFEFLACGLRQNSPEHLTDLYEIFCEHWSDIFHTFIDVFASNATESEISLIAAGTITELFSIVSNTTDSNLASFFEKILNQMLDQCKNSRDTPENVSSRKSKDSGSGNSRALETNSSGNSKTSKYSRVSKLSCASGEKTNGTALAEVLDDKVLKTLMKAKAVSSQLRALGAFASAMQSLIVNSKSAAEVLNRSVTIELLIEELEAMDRRVKKVTMLDVDKKKDLGSTFQVVNICLLLLRNIFYADKNVNKAKETAQRCGIVKLLASIWSWGQTNERIRSSILTLLQTFSENYEKGCNELARVSVGTTGHANSAQAGASSFLMILIRYLKEFLVLINVKVHAPIDIIKQVFRILTNAATSSNDCRTLYWKCGFMSEFVEACEKGTCPRKSRFQVLVLKYWFDLLLALSYHKSSQAHIGQIKDVLDSLAEIHYHWCELPPNKTLLLIRNVSFDENLKARIADHNGLLSILVKELESHDVLVKLLAAETFWTLANHTQRARAILKQKQVADNLKNCQTRTDHYLDPKNSNNIENLSPDTVNYYKRLNCALTASLDLLA